ncbi:MAG: hypothetical protein JW981_05820, partial [Anaerolineae bacterium]|nr:hypothetical protein [Anaerolineae bacterium]
VRKSADFLRTWDVKTAFSWVAYAEDQMNGRFADNTVLHLALAFAIQARRVSQGYKCQCSMETLSWLESQQIWPIAISLAQNIWPEFENTDLSSEVAVIAMHLLAGLRSTKWPVELQVVPELTDLINELLLNVSQAFFEPELRFDTSLRDGLVGHIIPALMQQRFKLWSPPSWSNGTLAYKYRHEYKIACELAELVTSHTGMTLPLGEIETLTLLLRAAYIRERPVYKRKAFVVCPSGMATAQLLVARLRARFPNLEILGALSFRELASPQVKEAQLLITTTPINAPWPGIHVIKVHPLLLPENIEAITNWLTF